MPAVEQDTPGLQQTIMNFIYPRETPLAQSGLHSSSESVGPLDDESETPALDAVAGETSHISSPPSEELKLSRTPRDASDTKAGNQGLPPSARSTTSTTSTSSSASASTPSSTTLTVADREIARKWLSACRRGNLNTCIELWSKNKHLLSYVSPFYYNYAPIHVATKARQHNIIQFLAENDADLNAQTLSGYTALHLAAQSNDKETINILRALGADRNMLDFFGQPYTSYINSRENEIISPQYNSSSTGIRSDTRGSRPPSIHEISSTRGSGMDSYQPVSIITSSVSASAIPSVSSSSAASTVHASSSSTSMSSIGRTREVIRDLLKINSDSRF